MKKEEKQIIGRVLDCLGSAVKAEDLEDKNYWIGAALQDLSEIITQ